MKIQYNIELQKDAIAWDVVNWKKAVDFWEDRFKNNSKVLELGCGENGGISLLMALNNSKILCSAYEEISETTKNIHKKYSIDDRIEYKLIDALSIPYEEEFDVICFKSILGGIVRSKDLKVAEKVISQIYKALKPGGKLLFAENLTSTLLHQKLRLKYGSSKNNWHYFTVGEIEGLFQKFTSFEYQTYGFLGCFGRNEQQRNFLGKIDTILFDNFLPKNMLYIISGVATK